MKMKKIDKSKYMMKLQKNKWKLICRENIYSYNKNLKKKENQRKKKEKIK